MGTQALTELQQHPVGRPGHNYGPAYISDNANAQFGDVINNYFPVSDAGDQKYNVLLDSLTFAQMGARMRNVADPLHRTCEWLFEDPKFKAWTDDKSLGHHRGFLWIKGKPGCGKSTIMKKALVWARNKWGKDTTMAYFFNARSSEVLEKSLLGLYRTWTHHLLTNCSSLKALFIEWFATKESNGDVEPWTEVELQNFLLACSELKHSPVATVFIDALDEGQGSEVRTLITFLEDMISKTTSAGVSLRICLSSRHYPHITVRYGLSLVVEDHPGHTNDIETYVRLILHEDDRQEMLDLRSEILERAQGVFLWAVLTVPDLVALYDQGQDISNMVERLRSMPQGLHDLYSALLAKDSKDVNQRTLLFQWVLYSWEPVTPSALYHAIHYASSRKYQGKLPLTSPDHHARFLLNCSRGMIQIVDVDKSTDTRGKRLRKRSFEDSKIVQFIHQSVRDYLLETAKKNSPSGNDAREDLLPFFSEDSCNMTIAHGCLRYLIQASEYDFSLTMDNTVSSLAWFAAKAWWMHLGLVKRELPDHLVELACDFLGHRSACLTWARHYDIDLYPYAEAEAHRPWLQDRGLPSRLYYAVMVAPPKVVKRLLSLDTSDVNSLGGKYGCALVAAARDVEPDNVEILLGAGADPNLRVSRGTALQEASALGNAKVIRALLEAGANINALKGVQGTALQAACRKGDEESVRLLLEKSPDLEIFNAEGKTALHLANEFHHQSVIHRLLAAGVDVNHRAADGRTALIEAAIVGNLEGIKSMLDAGANLYARDRQWGNVIQAAIAAGQIHVAEILLDLNHISPEHLSQMLSDAMCSHIFHGITTVWNRPLLDRGIDINRKGILPGHGRCTPMYVAVLTRNMTVVQLLLEDGAHVNLVEIHRALQRGWSRRDIHANVEYFLLGTRTTADCKTHKDLLTRMDESSPLQNPLSSWNEVRVDQTCITSYHDPHILSQRRAYRQIHITANNPPGWSSDNLVFLEPHPDTSQRQTAPIEGESFLSQGVRAEEVTL